MINVNIEFDKIYLDSSVKKTLKKYACLSMRTSKEYGGILLGKVTDNNVVIIEVATKPSVFDTSGTLWFIRSKKNAQKLINHWWKKSNGLVNYLGEWHTHPFESNIPSYGDANLLIEASRKNKNCFNFIIMIISDINGDYSITLENKEGIMTRRYKNG